MKILLLSDIHGNYPALEAVSRASAHHGCEQIVNCGDITVYAPFPNETIDWLRNRDVFSIRGNTDDKVLKLLKGKNFRKPSKPEKRVMYTSTAALLSPVNREYLLGLKKKRLLSIDGISYGLFHGSPADHEEFLFADTPEKRFRELAAGTSCKVVITGHSHSPYHSYVNGVHFINPGSVGRMFDGRPEASFAVLEQLHGTISVTFHRCPYDVEAVVKALQRYQLPSVYGEMFRTASKRN
ncbi:metallophosphoesterase family protein [Desulfobulbus alkaliphilus]|uniref:metallophosphoesterase family protein n=1 Tax=Desulfobulbus alkaliphilus TaxID=869814 RepID=UPI0019653D54|nr:metallophosphoesterase family protein [Desulfobulbus alkaliphilus]MBM9535489.1 metallophosphoesterase family protein [Desulfobulbus alkaliphilus]